MTAPTPATFTAHTPSGPTHCCVKHARQIEALARSLGAHVNFTKAPEGAQCSNCENEAIGLLRDIDEVTR